MSGNAAAAEAPRNCRRLRLRKDIDACMALGPPRRAQSSRIAAAIVRASFRIRDRPLNCPAENPRIVGFEPRRDAIS